MISRVNTAELEHISKDLLSAASDLETEFDALFTRFSNVPNVTKEWVGTQANFYFSRIAADKQQYTALVDKIRKIAQELNAETSNVQNCIKLNNTKN